MFFAGANEDEVREIIANAEPHEYLDDVRCISTHIELPEMLQNIAIGQKLSNCYFGCFTDECPDIAFFPDEKSRNTWVNTDPINRAAINEITDYLWSIKPGNVLDAVMNAKSDADGIRWIEF